MIYFSESERGFFDSNIHTVEQIPADALQISKELHASLLAGQASGKLIAIGQRGLPELVDPPPLGDEEVADLKVAVVQQHMDEAARAYRYDDIRTACTYADESAVPKFQAEGRAFRAWRSLVWAKCYEILGEVQAGRRPIPTDKELIMELPALELPAT
ncbi:hypothetical protein CSC67_08750 [Pusillimonas caeni]|uniref:hypothetical protein n=1 Tax=Pusillimonas caeni TaxID=1348472 RepID=UPI0010752A20|nr:hypothetical protein [Pusillimonas caeni]TFL14231.1 hypothetical protein CSC67_08750 [Pusillimonas caeni]